MKKIISLKTKEQFDCMMKIMKVKGYKWRGGERTIEKEIWETYKDQFCLRINDGILTFSHKEFYEIDEEIMSFEDFVLEELKILKVCNCCGQEIRQ